MKKRKKKPRIKKKRKKKPVEAYIIAALRKIWFYSSLRAEAVKLAKVGDKYKCAYCKDLFEKTQFDHIVPVGSAKNEDGTYDWNRFIGNLLYCPLDNIQSLCVNCHQAKTSTEANLRNIKKRKIKVDKNSKKK